MRRALVLTDESARHPFRASLPPSVCRKRVDDVEKRRSWRQVLTFEAHELRQAAMTYVAGFVATAAFFY